MKCYTDTSDTETSSDPGDGVRSRVASTVGFRSRSTSEQAVEEGCAVSSDKTAEMAEDRFQPVI